MIKCRRVTWTSIFSFSVLSKESRNRNSFHSLGSSRFINFGHLCAFSTYPSFSRSLYASLSLESHSILINPLKYKHYCYSIVVAVRRLSGNSDDFLAFLLRLSDDSLTTLWRLWWLSEDSLTTLWWLSDGSLMTLTTLTILWQISDDSLTTLMSLWQISHHE